MALEITTGLPVYKYSVRNSRTESAARRSTCVRRSTGHCFVAALILFYLKLESVCVRDAVYLSSPAECCSGSSAPGILPKSKFFLGKFRQDRTIIDALVPARRIRVDPELRDISSPGGSGNEPELTNSTVGKGFERSRNARFFCGPRRYVIPSTKQSILAIDKFAMGALLRFVNRTQRDIEPADVGDAMR